MNTATGNPLAPIAAAQGVAILDGGLATSLEERGFDLRDPLWSARLLIENPRAIRDLHLDFLRAGADCITAATYQASFEGFRGRGLGDEEAADLMRLAVALAQEARAAFWADEANRVGRAYPLVAASIGPYGAFLADGSEYRGDYGVTGDDLYAFHAARWRLLSRAGADLLACETIPSGPEARVLLRLMREHPACPAWLSFCCGASGLWDGTPLSGIAEACAGAAGPVALGVNCTAPRHVPALVAELRAATDRMIVVYPNRGETYDGESGTWGPGPAEERWLDEAAGWAGLGVAAIGGCCRIGPAAIAGLRQRLLAAGG